MENDIFMEISALLKRKALELGADFARHIEDCQKMIEVSGGWQELFNYALNAEEKVCDTISLKECIVWVKANLKAEIHGGAIISKMKNEQRLFSDKKLTLKVCFMDKDGRPLPDKESRFLIICTDNLDEDLTNTFGTKDTIVLK